MSEKAIEISNVSLVYQDRAVLENINWSLEAGSFVGLIGPNGAGKTILLKVILGLIKPTIGSVKIFGKNPKEVRGSIGYVPQHARFDFDFPIKVIDVVLMGRLAKRAYGRWYNKADYEVAEKCLSQVELHELRDRQVGKLSGGQLQRVLIARALASEPKILLLDEPAASLDSRIGTNVYELIATLAKEMTVILVSHDIGVLSSHVKTVACLNRRLHYHHSKELSGQILAEVYGCPVELIAHGHAHRVLNPHEAD